MASPGSPTKRKNNRIFKNITYAALIINAIQDSPKGRCTIDEICRYIEAEYSSDLPADLVKVWKACVRQTLSRDVRFIKLARRPGARISEWMYCPPFYRALPKKKQLSSLRHIRTALQKKGQYKEFYYKKDDDDENRCDDEEYYLEL